MTSRLNKPDTAADISLRECLDGNPQRCFIMIAGAGSGKTTSLIKALYHVLNTRRKTFKKLGQKVACITYTEVAAKEIWEDVGNDSQAEVSTIHSFLWNVIAPFQKDIKDWVLSRINEKVTELQAKADAFTPKTKSAIRETNAQSQAKLLQIRDSMVSVSRFNYGTGSNYQKGILGHDDILKIAPELLPIRPLLKTIIAQRFPVVFVDESQDTDPTVVSFLKEVAATEPNFCLGFFGDPMQKIYATGAGNIDVEKNWIKITKPENFRCSVSVRDVINRIRAQDDGIQQTQGRLDTPVGTAKIFVLNSGADRDEKLEQVRQFMAQASREEDWRTGKSKTLVVVHRMAAKRLGFPTLYAALNDKAPSELKDGLLDGTAWPLKLFLRFVLPLVAASKSGNEFGVIEILRQQCPQLAKEGLTSAFVERVLPELKRDVLKLVSLLQKDKDTSTRTVLEFIRANNLCLVDSRFDPYLENEGFTTDEIDGDSNLEALKTSMASFLDVPAKEFFGYKNYIQHESTFATQQGVKGTEFERVLVILDDDEGTHNLFSFDKFFLIKPLSKTDSENLEQGKDYCVPRTRRLFYVSCSRALRDLAIVYFVEDSTSAIEKVREANIFNHDDIVSYAEVAAALQ